MIDFFNSIPKERIDYYDMTESFEDFTPTQLESEDLYFKDKIEKYKDWDIDDQKFKEGKRKHQTTS